MQTVTPKLRPMLLSGLMAAAGACGFWGLLWLIGFAAPAELTFDERFMIPVVDRLSSLWPDWSILWDFEDTKGPGFFVPAAILSSWGVGLEGLRLTNLMLSMCSAGILGIVAKKGWRAAAATGLLLAVLPYHTVLSHLFMSEPSFVLGSIILGTIATTGPRGEPGIWRPVAFGLVLTVLLHHRAHAVVPAAAAILVALQRDGSPSWRYAMAGCIAGVLRLPLYIEWDGLVSPMYADRYGLGFSPESVVYLLGALTPFVLVGIPLGLQRSPRLLLWIGGLTALAALWATPDLMSLDGGSVRRYQGLMASALLPLPQSVQPIALALGAAAGAMGLMGLNRCLPSQRFAAKDGFGHYAWYLLFFGCLLYVATRGAVYDRYLLCFAAGLPILLVRHTPGWATLAQGVIWITLTLCSASTWLNPSA